MIRERELFVIDNPLQAHLLMTKLKAALPLPALATPPMLAQLREQAVDYDAKRNGFKQTGFACLFQAL